MFGFLFKEKSLKEDESQKSPDAGKQYVAERTDRTMIEYKELPKYRITPVYRKATKSKAYVVEEKHLNYGFSLPYVFISHREIGVYDSKQDAEAAISILSDEEVNGRVW